jgi:hypothetical protein
VPDEPNPACVHERTAKTVKVERTWSAMGEAAHAIGWSARPIGVSFRCGACGKVFERSTDPDTLRRYRG